MGVLISHDEAIDLMAKYLARELTPDEHDRFVSHIKGCQECHDKLLALELYLTLVSIEDKGGSDN